MTDIRKTALLAACASAALAGTAFAQSAPQEDESFGEIVVTAQKREQKLQEVPVSVTVVNSQLLEDSGVKDIKELTVLTPGLVVTSTSNETVTTARIRGIGTVGDNPGLESSVGVVIDGVYRPRNGVGFGDLGELERVEVLKGPQGTLFGKNTSAGVINIVTAPPRFTFGTSGEVTFSEYGGFGVAGSMTGPIVEDKLAGRIYLAHRQREGFMDVRTLAGPRAEFKDNDQNFVSVRGSLLAVVSDNLDFKVSFDMTARDENCCAAVQLASPNPGTANAAYVGQTVPLVNAVAGGTAVLRGSTPFARIAYSNRDTTQDIDETGLSVEANWDLGWADFVSISAMRSWQLVAGQDADFTGADIWYRPADGRNGADFDTFSHEMRLQGESDFAGGKLNWLGGVFYANEKLTNRSALLYGSHYGAYFRGLLGGAAATLPAVGITTTNTWQANQGAVDVHKQSADTIAFFTNNSLTLGKLEATLGLRYTIDNKDVTSTYQTQSGPCAAALTGQGTLLTLLGGSTATLSAVLGNLCLPWHNAAFDASPIVQTSEEKEWSGTAKLAYKFSPELFGYGSFSRGYKAGGFNLDREQNVGLVGAAIGAVVDRNTAFPGEFVDSYELGLKSTLMDGRMLLNVSAFDQTFTDFQLNTFLGTNFIVTRIPEVTSKGAEATLLWQTPIKGLDFQGGVNYQDTKYGSFTPVASALALLPGSRMSFAPEWTASGAISYEAPFIGNLFSRVSVNGRWTSEYNTGSDLLPNKLQEAFALFNARFAVGPEDDRWSLEFWAQNLTDENYIQVAFNGPLQGSVTSVPTGAPRAALSLTSSPAYDARYDTLTYDAFLGAPRVIGVTLRFKR